MTAEDKLINVTALGEAKSIDFANKLGIGLKKLFEALGVTNKTPMSVGSVLKQYRFKVTDSTAANGEVAEGEVIPLTKVERELVKITELKFHKYRKSTSAEAIQSHGYDAAVNKTDNEMKRYVQKTFRKEFFNFLKAALDDSKRTDKKALTANNLQGALAIARANLSVKLDDEITPLAFVNPNDVATHIAENVISSNGATFGLNLLTDFVGAKVIEFADIPEGEVWFTVAENLNVAYANPNGDLSLAFPLKTDETGLVGIMHDVQKNRLTTDTIYVDAIAMFPENIDLVTKVTIGKKGKTTTSTSPSGAGA